MDIEYKKAQRFSVRPTLTRWLAIATILLPQAVFSHPGVHAQIESINRKIAEQGSYSLYAERAHLNYEGGHLQAALHDLDKASKLGSPVPLFYEYANIYAAKGELKKSLDYFNRYMKFNPSLPQAFQGRARVYKRLGNSERAIEDFKQALQLDRQPNPGIVIETAELMLAARQAGPRDALAWLDESMKRLGVLGQLQDKAIQIESSSGNHQAAVERMLALGKERQFNPFWRVDYVVLLQRAARIEDALRELNVAALALESTKKTKAVDQLLHRIGQIRSELSKSGG